MHMRDMPRKTLMHMVFWDVFFFVTFAWPVLAW